MKLIYKFREVSWTPIESDFIVPGGSGAAERDALAPRRGHRPAPLGDAWLPAGSNPGTIVTYSTLWWTNIAIENGHWNSGFSHSKWWFFKRVTPQDRNTIYIHHILHQIISSFCFIREIYPERQGLAWFTLWWTNSLLLNMAIEVVDFPINSMVIFHSKMLVHQRVTPKDRNIIYINLHHFVSWFG